MPSVFISYSHNDESFRAELEKQLAMLQREGTIDLWHDHRIAAGDELDATISAKLEAAEVILLLVSPDFLASRYCYDVEVKRAMQRHEEGTARVIPVILRVCEWNRTPFAKLKAAPKDGKAITKWTDRDEAFLDVVQHIRAGLATKLSPPKAVHIPLQHPVPRASTPRSSNLRIKKEFTEADEDQFRDDTFDFMAKFFEGSLEELAARNVGVEGRFKRIDARTFSAVIYKNGKIAAGCSVRNGNSNSFGLGAGISYSHDESGRANSMNESLTVEANDQSLSLRPMFAGAFMSQRKTNSHLTAEGAAEYYWSLLIAPLQ